MSNNNTTIQERSLLSPTQQLSSTELNQTCNENEEFPRQINVGSKKRDIQTKAEMRKVIVSDNDM